MRSLDISSWQALLTTLLGLAVITLIGVGIRLIVMQTVQQRRERENRQINERLRTLIAAYKTLGGSFTGDLAVDPAHLRDLQAGAAGTVEIGNHASSDRARRIRDAVEAALSDVILLGTEEQVRLAAQAATELAAGRRVHTAELVISLRGFIRQVLDLDPVPTELPIPRQGPTRPGGGGRGSARAEGGGAESGKQGGGRGAGGNVSLGAGAGAGGAVGLGIGAEPGSHEELHR